MRKSRGTPHPTLPASSQRSDGHRLRQDAKALGATTLVMAGDLWEQNVCMLLRAYHR